MGRWNGGLGRTGQSGTARLEAADAGTGAGSAPQSFTFREIPADPAALTALPEASLDTPYKTAALAMAALLRYEASPEDCFAMLDVLRGPEPMTPMARGFLTDRLRGAAYKPRSFFKGATPENNYAPSRPYVLEVSANPTSFQEDNWATLYVRSAGADAPRPIRLRRKPSEGRWYLSDIQCLSDIRLPAAADPWA